MHLKQFLGAVLSAALLCTTPAVQTTAKAIEPYCIVAPLYDTSCDAQSELFIISSNAECTSRMKSNDTVKIVAEQYLQKQGFLWIWSTYNNTTWTKTAYTNVIAMSNTKTGLSSGKYRLKTVFTLTDKQGKTETITVYSDVKSVG